MKTFGKTIQALIFGLLLPQLALLLGEFKVKVEGNKAYCINGAYPPCTDLENNNRICNEYMNEHGYHKCTENKHCVFGRKCDKTIFNLKIGTCAGKARIEFQICRLTNQSFQEKILDKKSENLSEFTICIGDTSSLRACTADKQGTYHICNEFLNLQGPSTCNTENGCFEGRKCSGIDISHGYCSFKDKAPKNFTLEYKNCNASELFEEKNQEITSLGDEKLKFNLCDNNQKLKACTIRESSVKITENVKNDGVI